MMARCDGAIEELAITLLNTGITASKVFTGAPNVRDRVESI
jgi:hypothetical protein